MINIDKVRLESFLLLKSFKCLTIPVKNEDKISYVYDNKYINLNKDFTDKEAVRTYTHEILHILLGHFKRKKNLNITNKNDSYLFNIAADYIVNNIVIELYKYNNKKDYPNVYNFYKPIIDLFDKISFAYSIINIKNKSTEELYKLLKRYNESVNPKINKSIEDEESNDVNSNKQIFKLDIVDEIPNIEDEESIIEIEKINKKLIGMGIGTYNINSELNIINNPIDLKRELNKYLHDKIINGTEFITYKKLSKLNLCFKDIDIRFKKNYNKKLNVSIAIDTSGSIDNKDLETFYSIIKNNLKYLKGKIIYFTNKVVSIVDINDIDFENLTRNFTGGTDLKDVFKHFIKFKSDLNIVMTDLFVNIPKEKLNNLLWIIPMDQTVIPEYGKVIKY
jgi:predicted metal-dependent peptidase